MSEPRTTFLPKAVSSLSNLIRQNLMRRRRAKLDRSHEILADLKREKDQLIDQMDKALRAMQRQRKLKDSGARLTGQYLIEELRPVRGGETFDIKDLTLALDHNSAQIAREQSRVARLTKALMPSL